MTNSTEKIARHQSRLLAVQAFFAFVQRGVGTSEELVSFSMQGEGPVPDPFAVALVDKAIGEYARLRVILRAYASQTRFEKIAQINKVLIYLGVCELLHFATPPAVIINEYVELAKTFGEEKSAGFINGVLDAFRGNITKE